MSRMLDNFINGNRSDVRADLAEMPVKDACLAVVDLLEDLLDRDGVLLDDADANFADIRRLLEAM